MYSSICFVAVQGPVLKVWYLWLCVVSHYITCGTGRLRGGDLRNVLFRLFLFLCSKRICPITTCRDNEWKLCMSMSAFLGKQWKCEELITLASVSLRYSTSVCGAVPRIIDRTGGDGCCFPGVCAWVGTGGPRIGCTGGGGRGWPRTTNHRSAGVNCCEDKKKTCYCEAFHSQKLTG